MPFMSQFYYTLSCLTEVYMNYWIIQCIVDIINMSVNLTEKDISEREMLSSKLTKFLKQRQTPMSSKAGRTLLNSPRAAYPQIEQSSTTTESALLSPGSKQSYSFRSVCDATSLYVFSPKQQKPVKSNIYFSIQVRSKNKLRTPK